MENKQDKGFTLVELLIVIVILGILATVTVFAVRGITDQGKQSSCATEEATILTAAEAYYAKNGSAPADFDAMTPEYLTDDPAELALNWTFAGGDATTAASVTATGTGKCSSYTP